MTLPAFFDHFAQLADAPNGVAKLRELILQLAVQGKLTQNWRNSNDYSYHSDWRKVDFFGFCVLQRGYDLPLAKSEKGHFPIVTSAGISGYHSVYKVEGPGVVVGRSGSIGKVFYIEDNFWAHNTTLFVKDFKGNYPRYVYYYLQSFKAQQFSLSTAVPTLNRNHLRGILVDIPPYSEQQEIVCQIESLMLLCDELEARQRARGVSRLRLNNATLAPLNQAAALPPAELAQAAQRLSDNFATLYQTPATVAQLRATILQLAVQGKLVPQDENDEPASVLLKSIEKERLLSGKKKRSVALEMPIVQTPFAIPNRWAWANIGDLAQLIEYGTSEKSSLDSKGVPVLRMNNIEGGKVHHNNLKYAPPTIKDLPRLYLQHNELLFNRTNSFELVGKTGVFKGRNDTFTFASYLIRVRLNEAYISPDYVCFAMNADYYRETQINPEVTQQCGQANFNGTKLALSLVPLPPFVEQKRIVAKVNQLMALCDELEARLRQAEADGARLMQAAVRHLLEAVNHYQPEAATSAA